MDGDAKSFLGLSHEEARARYGDAVLVAYSVKDRPGKTSIWTAIGAAYPHNTGNGLTVVLDALPVGNRVVLLEPDAPIMFKA
jgi:hypothetical protein